ncbi:Serpin-ZXB [Apostasia shenzhenica]|uniref:Serpin-ZXB n=1 Tax=Apostasia shenzhenica TaxID=1088818 RepID=A0A2I0BD77_9ASPA|nr:Serpin-ZXB [Apostasia shenzhenica]
MPTADNQIISCHSDFKFSVYFFLPEAHQGLWSLIQKMVSDPDFVNNYEPCQKVRVGKFKRPKFKISIWLEASMILKILGLSLPFGSF